MHVVVTVKAAALATHAAVEPESRCAARKPTCEASDGRDEHEEPELAQRGAQQGPPPVDRREQHVAHLGLLEDQRAAPAARPQRDGDDRRGREPEPGRTVGRDRGHLVARDRPVPHDPGDAVERDAHTSPVSSAR